MSEPSSNVDFVDLTDNDEEPMQFAALIADLEQAQVPPPAEFAGEIDQSTQNQNGGEPSASNDEKNKPPARPTQENAAENSNPPPQEAFEEPPVGELVQLADIEDIVPENGSIPPPEMYASDEDESDFENEDNLRVVNVRRVRVTSYSPLDYFLRLIDFQEEIDAGRSVVRNPNGTISTKRIVPRGSGPPVMITLTEQEQDPPLPEIGQIIVDESLFHPQDEDEVEDSDN